jgi:hypothetical protein
VLPSGSRTANMAGASGMRMTSGSVSTPPDRSAAWSRSASVVTSRMPVGISPETRAMVVADPGGATSIQRASPKGRSRRFSKPSRPT